MYKRQARQSCPENPQSVVDGIAAAIPLGRLADPMEAVSYTHLDVYKRQAPDRAGRNARGGQPPCAFALCAPEESCPERKLANLSLIHI